MFGTTWKQNLEEKWRN